MRAVFSMHHSPNHPLVVAPLVCWRAKWLSDKREAVCDLGSLGKFSPVSLELTLESSTNSQIPIPLPSLPPTLHSTPNRFMMASRTFSRALRSPLARQLSAPARRTFVSAINASARPTARAVVASTQQVRGVKTIDFAGTKEDVYGTVSGPLVGVA
jgi:hypothetical protein